MNANYIYSHCYKTKIPDENITRDLSANKKCINELPLLSFGFHFYLKFVKCKFLCLKRQSSYY